MVVIHAKTTQNKTESRNNFAKICPLGCKKKKKEKVSPTGWKAASHCERCWQVPEAWPHLDTALGGRRSDCVRQGSLGPWRLTVMVPVRPPDSPVTPSWLDKVPQLFAGLLLAPLALVSEQRAPHISPGSQNRFWTC